MTVLLPTHQQCREVARLYRLRTQLRLEAGDVDGACADALACHRLGRLVARHPALICYMIGTAVDAMAAEMGEAIILSGQLTPGSAAQLHDHIEALPPFPDLADIVDHGDRLQSLDTLLSIVDDPGERSEVLFAGLMPHLDPNVVLRDANTVYDAWVANLRGEDRASRSAKFDELVEDLREAVHRKPNRRAALHAALRGDPAGYTKQISATFVALMFPAIQQEHEAAERAEMRTRIVLIGAALAEHRAATGAFPETLDALGLDSDALHDLYTGASLNYRRVDDGFLLYSLGPNGRNDGGRSLLECEGERTRCDDIRFGLDPPRPDPADH